MSKDIESEALRIQAEFAEVTRPLFTPAKQGKVRVARQEVLQEDEGLGLSGIDYAALAAEPAPPSGWDVEPAHAASIPDPKRVPGRGLRPSPVSTLPGTMGSRLKRRPNPPRLGGAVPEVIPLPENRYLVPIDLGVRGLVLFLQGLGYRTSDSGDGVSKTHEDRELDLAHVVIAGSAEAGHILSPWDAERIASSLDLELAKIGSGIKVAAGDLVYSYDPVDSSRIIILTDVRGVLAPAFQVWASKFAVGIDPKIG